MRVAEIFQSIQGEGFLTGSPSTFVRASGCNLRCVYCDTPYASWRPEGDDLSVDEIVKIVTAGGRRHVVITGGEPMLLAEMIPLCQQLRQRGFHITMETAGTLYLPVTCDLMSISPKTSNSTPTGKIDHHWVQRHERTRHAPSVVQRLIEQYEYQFKFVVSRKNDLGEIEGYLRELPAIERSRVMLMPEGTSRGQLQCVAEWLEPYCRSARLHFCPRRHIDWFGWTRGS